VAVPLYLGGGGDVHRGALAAPNKWVYFGGKELLKTNGRPQESIFIIPNG